MSNRTVLGEKRTKYLDPGYFRHISNHNDITPDQISINDHLLNATGHLETQPATLFAQKNPLTNSLLPNWSQFWQQTYFSNVGQKLNPPAFSKLTKKSSESSSFIRVFFPSEH